ncbi:MAG: TldD/PmbA family protein [Acidimicrobiaceae bacterium]|nr:TldD/PmbA family protein [Acidimicrobiaceae bacterium]
MSGVPGVLEGVALSELSSAALSAAKRLGARHAEVRVERIRTQGLSLRDGEVEGSADDVELGLGIRVVRGGSIGFAATVELTPEAAARCAAAAVDTAEVTGSVGGPGVELAPEPSYGEVQWIAPYGRDPTEVPLADKVELLEAWSRQLLSATVVDHVTASLIAVAEEKYLADLSGTVTRQRRVRLHPSLEALAVSSDGTFETMRTVAPPAGRGWEYLEGDGWDFSSELAELPEHLAEKLSAPSVEPGPYDLVIDPTNLWLTIHESVGHATELDRALGYEAAYAGTSFATFDKLGSLRYGSELMNVTGDRTAPHGLATIGYDDEAVAAQTFPLVADGVLVGYQLDRRIAAEARLGRSNGCAFGCSPLMIPIQRMANVSLAPAAGEGPSTEELISGVERGIYVVGDKSWSIDMQRHNFQFTGQRFFRIEHGRLAGQVRDVAYQSRTTDFWGSLAGLGGRSTYLLAGAMNCGKGQPGQVAPVSHGCPSALFRQVNVLNTRHEAGR